MLINAIKENIYSIKNLDRQSIQIQLQSDHNVSDMKPDIKKIIQNDCKLTVEDYGVEANRIKFKGKVMCDILYLADNNENPIHNIAVDFDFEDFINLDEINEDDIVNLNGTVENVRVEMLNSRKIHVSALAEITGIAEGKYKKEVIVNVEDINDLQVKKNTITARQLISNKNDKFIIKDEIAVPMEKANISEILWCDINIKNKNIKVLEGKTVINGELNVSVLYVGENDDKPMEFIEKDVSFSGIIVTEGSTQEMYSNVDMKIGKQYIQVMPDIDGEERVLELEVVSDLNVKVYSMESKELVEDLYSTSQNLKVIKKNECIEKLVCKNQMQGIINETIKLNTNMPAIMQVLYASAKPKIDDVELLNDRVIAEGVIFSKIIYVAEDDDNPLCSFNETIPFKQVIETRNSKPNDSVEINPSVEYTTCNMISSNEVDIRCSIVFDTNVIAQQEVELITEIEQDEEEKEEIPGVVVYVLEQGETLWDIAKVYATTVDELLKINEIEDEKKISAGDKILIVKNSK